MRFLHRTMVVAAFFVAVLPSVVQGDEKPECFSEEIRRNVSLQLGGCTAGGRHAMRRTLAPGSYRCRAFAGDVLNVAAKAEGGACGQQCKGGERLAMPTEGGEELVQPTCVKCPANHFSVGGGQLIREWGAVGSGNEEPTAPHAGRPGWGASGDMATSALPPQFETVCYGFNDTTYQETGSMNDAWQRGLACTPWAPSPDGTFLSSGASRDAHKVRSELRARLRFVTKGKLWFSYRVDSDGNPAAISSCPWLQGDTAIPGEWECLDGTRGDAWTCNEHGGRGKCPANFPEMCAQPSVCAGGLAFCCSIDCAGYGGQRLCPATGGLQVLLCRDTRLRSCQPQPLLPLVSRTRYYVSSQLQWRWVEIDMPEGWSEIRFNYMRDGAVLGEDQAFIGEVGWSGSKLADEACHPCPEGKQSVAGSDRCSHCERDTVWDRSTGGCRECNSNEYALPGFEQCVPRPVCTREDYVAKYEECNGNSQKRLKYFQWLEPKICQNQGISLPSSTRVECEPCREGLFRPDSSGSCQECEAGKFSQGKLNEKCKTCPAGKEALRRERLFQWDEWPEGMTTGCVGQCGSHGWRLRTYMIDSGFHHIAPAQSWLQMAVNLTAQAVVSFSYDLLCDAAVASFNFSVNGIDLPLEHQCARIPSMVPKSAHKSFSVSLPVGLQTLKWSYYKLSNNPGRHPMDEEEGDTGPQTAPNEHTDMARVWAITVINSEQGGASSCTPCPPGTFSDSPTSRCKPCEAGSSSPVTVGAGGVSSRWGARACEPCAMNTFAPVPGSSECRPCGAGTTAHHAATECSAALAGLPRVPLSAAATYSLGSLEAMAVIGPLPLASSDWTGGANGGGAGSVGKEGDVTGLYIRLGGVLVGASTGAMIPADPSAPEGAAAAAGGGLRVPKGCLAAYACEAVIREGIAAPGPPPDDYRIPMAQRVPDAV
ncbi:hypothetical protein T484DRAFT_2024348, partial [Baffinella frigidus]